MTNMNSKSVAHDPTALRNHVTFINIILDRRVRYTALMAAIRVRNCERGYSYESRDRTPTQCLSHASCHIRQSWTILKLGLTVMSVIDRRVWKQLTQRIWPTTSSSSACAFA